MNALRFHPDAPLYLQIPLSKIDVPAVQAVLGHVGIAEGVDYRGVKVLADIHPVPDTNWFMVAKIDSKEAFSQVRSLGITILIIVLLAVLMAAAYAAYIYNHRNRLLIQEKYKSEQKRFQAEEETRTALYSIGDGVICTDEMGLITRMNPTAETLTGWSEAEARGKPLTQIFHIINEISRIEVENPVSRVQREGLIVGLANHTLLIARDGTECPIADSGAPIRDKQGEIKGVVLVFRDQTRERTLQRERSLLNYAIATSLNEIFLFDAETLHFRFVNSGALENLGYSMEQMRSMTPLDIKPEFTLESFKSLVKPLLDQEETFKTFETIHQRANGTHYPIEVRLQLLEFEGERVFFAVINDISERVRFQTELQQNEARLVQAQAAAHVGNWEINLVDSTMWASEEAFRMYGLERTSPYIPLAQAQQIPLADDRPRLDAALKDLIQADKEYNLEFRICRENDKERRIVRSTAQLIRDTQGLPVRVTGTIQDITNLRSIEESLVESEQRYRSLFENSQAVMLLINPENGAIVNANHAAAAFYGWTVEELLQMNVNQINILPADQISQLIMQSRTKQRNLFYFQHRIKNGEIREVQVFSGPILVSGQTLLYSIIEDITQRVKAEKQVLEQLEELKRWHSAILGREMRNLELKAEINELLSQAGLPPRYSNAEPGENQ